LPDRGSLALVTQNWHAAAIRRMRLDREPHIGEYDAKTNAFYDFSQIPAAPE
jgi:hypothetical protein